MVKYTPAYLKKLEDLLKEGAYEVRYEKGNFKSGYCILEEKRVVVINKFSTLESRIQALMEIIQAMAASGHLNSDLKQAGMKNPIVMKELITNVEIEFEEGNPENAISNEKDSDGESPESEVSSNNEPTETNEQ